MSTFFPIEMCFTCSLSLNCHPVSLFLSPLSPRVSLFPPLYFSNLDTLICFVNQKFRCALCVILIRWKPTDFIEDSNGYEEFIGSCGRDGLLSNRQSPTPTLCCISSPSFWWGNGRLQILRIEPPAIRILKRPGQTDRSKINSPDYWLSAAILCCRSIFYWITAQPIKLSTVSFAFSFRVL